MKKKITIGIIGGGNMGSAIISGVRKKYRVLVCEKDAKRVAALRKRFRISSVDLTSLTSRCAIIILAVKPQDFDGILQELKGSITNKHLVVSIAAGITTQYIEKRLGRGVRVIRTMPNLPVQVGAGFTALAKGRHASGKGLRIAQEIFRCVGATLNFSESKLDAVTAISGSGPAYFFLFAEAFIDAAKHLGLSDKEALAAVNATLVGSNYLYDASQEDAKALRSKVTSKGGTTQAAMDEFFRGKFKEVFLKATQAAKRRSKELSK